MTDKTCRTCAYVSEPWEEREESCLFCVMQIRCMTNGKKGPCGKYQCRFTGMVSRCVIPENVESVIRESCVSDTDMACNLYMDKDARIGKICGQCGNIISPFTDKTTPRPCMFREDNGRWNGADRLFDDPACAHYHERWTQPPVLNHVQGTTASVQLDLALWQ